MTAKIVFVLLLLPLLSVDGGKKSIAKFTKKHINPAMKADQCTDVIAGRLINNKNNCREINTFILAEIDKVKTICQQGNGVVESDRVFNVLVCCRKGKKSTPPCSYGGYETKHRIKVECKNGNPLHYDDVDQCPDEFDD
ncbi:ribonuclease-like [Synchiropus splendidus]|uniref:ribonuclease-like n=1 Tax=Synchiropus splendidus TaxID=270530 RepID=UPI00237DA713|nr:ribonuclease-like [Synchiropus splendidus]